MYILSSLWMLEKLSSPWNKAWKYYSLETHPNSDRVTTNPDSWNMRKACAFTSSLPSHSSMPRTQQVCSWDRIFCAAILCELAWGQQRGKPPGPKEQSEKPKALILIGEARSSNFGHSVFSNIPSKIRSHVFIILNNPSQLMCLLWSFQRKMRSALRIGKNYTCEYRHSQELYLVCTEYIF